MIQKFYSLLYYASLMILFSSLSIFTVYAETTVTTDKLDYWPGETVIITGSGFEANETVTIVIEHLIFEHANDTISTTADESGAIYDASYVIDEIDLGEAYLLTATDNYNHYAETYFTDGAADNGDGILTVTPVFRCDPGEGLSYSFSFNGGTNNTWADGSALTIDVPWNIGTGNYTFVSGTNATMGTVSVGTSTIYPSGKLITIPFRTTSGNGIIFNFTISGTGVNMPANSNYELTAKTKYGSSGTLTTIGVSPKIAAGNGSNGKTGVIYSSLNSCSSANSGTLEYYGSGTTYQWQYRTLTNPNTNTWSNWTNAPGNSNETSYNLSSNGAFSGTVQFKVVVTGSTCGTGNESEYTVRGGTAPTIIANNIISYGSFTPPFGEGTNVTIYTATSLNFVKYFIGGTGGTEISSGYTFSAGATTVTVQAQNTCGTSTETFTVTTGIVPKIMCPANITHGTDPGQCQAIFPIPLTWDGSGATANPTAGHYIGNPQPTIYYSFNDITWIEWPTDNNWMVQKGSFTIYLKATNAAGTSTTCSFTVTVVDDEAPVLAEAPAAVTVQCIGDVPAMTSLAYTDNCDADGSVTGVDGPLVGGACGGTITRTWNVTDASGNIAVTRTQIITVDDNTPPTWTITPSNKIVECNGTGNTVEFAAWLTAPSGTDNCSIPTFTTNFDPANIDDFWTAGDCGNTGYFTVTFYLTDACQNQISETKTFTIKDETDPYWTTAPANEIVECDGAGNTAALAAWLAAPAGDDVCGTAAMTTNFDPLTSWTQQCGGTGYYTVTFYLTDECQNQISETKVFTIKDETDPYWTTAPANEIVECDGAGNTAALEAWLAAPAGDDVCGTAAMTHTESWTQLCGGTGYWTAIFTLTDQCGNDISETKTFTIKDETDPYWTTAPANETVECDGGGNTAALTAWLAAPAGDDVCGTAAMTHTEAWTQLCGSTGYWTAIFTLTDQCGNDISETKTFTIKDETDPYWTTAPANEIVECDGAGNTAELAAWLAAPAGDDVCGTAAMTHTEAWTQLCGGTGYWTAVFTLTDQCGNDISETKTFTIKDETDPYWTTAPVDMTVECDGGGNTAALTAWLAAPAGDDVCGTAAMTHTEVWTQLCGGTGYYTVTFYLTDQCDNQISSTKVFTIKDQTPPSITCPADITQANDAGLCSANLTIPLPAVSDICDPNVIIVNSFSNNLVQNGDFNSGTSHWKDCGNIAEVETEDHYICCPAPSTSSNYDAEIDGGVSLCQNISGFTSGHEYILTFKASRRQNNTESFPNPMGAWVRIINGATNIINEHVQRTNTLFNLTPTSYRFIANASTLKLTFTPDATNTTSLGLIVDDIAIQDVSGSPYNASGVYPVGETKVVWNAIDQCGNISSCTQTVTVNDNEKPVITTNGNKTVNNDAGLCSAVVIVSASATDNCGVGDPIGVRSDAAALTDPYPVGTTTITWNVTDIHGNAAIEVIQTITVNDTEPPTFTCPTSYEGPTDAGSCSKELTIEAPIVTDNCGTNIIPVNNYNPNLVQNGDINLGNAYWQDCSNSAEAWASECTYGGSDCSNRVTEVDDVYYLCQNISGFTVGKEYTLSFKASRRTNGAPNPVGVYVKVNDGSSDILNEHVQRANTTFKLTPEFFKFTATQPTMKLTFIPDANNWWTLGLIIDDISIRGTDISASFPFGETEIVWTAVDQYGNASSCTQTIDVNEVKTVTTVSVDPTSKQYSDSVKFEANVSPNCNGIDGAGALTGSVIFKVGDQVMGPAVPLVNGEAIATYALLEPTPFGTAPTGNMAPGTHTVTADFTPTNTNYSTSSDDTQLIITQEDADITYNGDTYFTANPNTKCGDILLSAYVVDRNDAPPVGVGARGDIRNAKITFFNGINQLGTVPVGLINPNETTQGNASYTFNECLNNSQQSSGGEIFEILPQTYNTTGTASSYYQGGISGEPIVVTLAMPGQDYVTGGGHIVMSNTSGLYPGLNNVNKRMNFGLVMKWNKSGKNLQGNINVIYRGMYQGQPANFQIKSNAINSLNIQELTDFRKATITTKANFKAMLSDGTEVTLGGNHALTMTAWESTTVLNGSLDRVSVQLIPSSGSGILFSSNWSSGKTVDQQLNGGKIQVKHSNQKIGAPENEDAIAGNGLNVYPNPFHTTATVRFSVADAENVTITITNSLGRVVRELVSEEVTAGEYNITWDGLGTDAQELSSGVYFITLTTGSFTKTVPVTLIK